MAEYRKYRKKPIVVEAVQWHENGDHPEDICVMVDGYPPHLSEGKVVRRYRTPDLDGYKPCRNCGERMDEHGWIDTLEGGHIVCPGDWIITGVVGEKYPCKPEVFEAIYEEIREAVVKCR